MDYFNHQPPADAYSAASAPTLAIRKTQRPSESEKLQFFNNPQFGKVRVIIEDNGNPIFCLTDSCKALDLNPSKVAQRLSDDVLAKYPSKQ